MGNFVQVNVGGVDVDHLNRSHIVRVQAEAIAHDSWVVKVLVTTGLEVTDSRHTDRESAEARVAELLS